MIRYSFLLLGAALGAFSAPAQQPLRQGVISYDLVVNIREQAAKKHAALAAMLPENIHVALDVPFRDARFAVVSREATADASGMQMRVAGGSKKDIVDLAAGRERSESIINGRAYYTEDATRPAKITPAAGTRTIAGYPCRKALVTPGDGEQYTVWYTTALPYAYSPKGLELAALKGAVLAYSNEEMSATAVRVSAAGFSEAALQPNTKARKVTGEQLNDLQEDALAPAPGSKAIILKP